MTDSTAEDFIAGRTDRYRTVSTHDHRPERRSRTVFPSFYDAVHRAWNSMPAFREHLSPCFGTLPYEPDEHRCYALAGALRVELHAGGITLSNDGNGESSFRELLGLTVEGDGSGQVLPDAPQSIGLFGVEPDGADRPPDHAIESLQKFSAGDEAAWRAAIARSEEPIAFIDDVPDRDELLHKGGFIAALRTLLGLR